MPDLAISHVSTPYVSVYPFTTGFGSRYSNPATLPTGTGNGLAFSPSGTLLAIAHDNSPYISLYPWSAGFGVKYADPSTLPAFNGLAVAFRTGDSAIAVAHLRPPNISVYPLSSGFGTKYSDPATLPASDGTGVAFSPDGSDIAVAHGGTPFISVYPWNAGFGTKYTDPGTLPVSDATGVTFSSSGTVIIVANIGSPSVAAYAWSSGFGTKYADPGTLPASDGTGVAFRTGDTAIALTQQQNPAIAAYTWSSGFGTSYSDPGLPGDGEGQKSAAGVAWNSAGDYIAIAHVQSPYVSVYPWTTASGFGTKVSDPTILPGSDALGVFWLPTTVVTGGSPYLYYALQRLQEDDRQMSGFLRQATTLQQRTIGPFISDSDFKTLQTTLTIANTDIHLLINGVASVKNAGGATHLVNGEYEIIFNDVDTAIVGELKVNVVVSSALVVFATFFVLEEVVYDALYAAGALGFTGLSTSLADATADITQVLTRLPDELVGGRMKVYPHRYRRPGRVGPSRPQSNYNTTTKRR